MNTTDLTDAELTVKVAKKDGEAFEELTKRYHRKVFAFAWRLSLNASDAEDLTQETFLKIWRFASKFDPKAAFSTWLYAIVYNGFLDMRRRKKPFGQSDFPLEEVADEHSLEQEGERQSLSGAVAAALTKLPALQREALTLCYYEELTAKQAAQVMNLSQTAVEMLLFRARQTLKSALAPLKKELSS